MSSDTGYSLTQWQSQDPKDSFLKKISPGKAGGYFSLSKNYPNTPVSAIIEETGVFAWKAGEKMHGMSQSS